MSYGFYQDAARLAARRKMRWYHDNLPNVLRIAKQRQTREIDASIALAEKLNEALEEALSKPVVVPLRELEQFKDDSLMKPIEPEVTDILYKGTEKGAGEKYLKVRNKKSPEDKFYFRITTNWDYGWQQKQARVPARDVNRGRYAIIKDTFYLKNNLAPDPAYYAKPMGGEMSSCAQDA